MELKAVYFIFIYGMLAAVGLFLSAFWGRLAYKRARYIEHKWYIDRYFILTANIALVSIGQTINNAARSFGNIHYGLSPILLRVEGYFIGAGLLVLFFGLFGLVWLADLEEHPPSWRWLKVGAVLSVCWAVASYFIQLHIPPERIVF